MSESETTTPPGQKTKPLNKGDGTLDGYVVFCPGCKSGHLFRTETLDDGGKAAPVWGFNGNLAFPTFTPSRLVNRDRPESRCHSFVRNGKIQFLVDSFHELAGRIVDLPDISEW
jgi:hypothetical protein